MNFRNQKVTLGLMIFLALMLPLMTFLGQQKQENRSFAYTQLGQACKNTSSCQPPLICSNYVCKKDGVVRTGNKGLNESCKSESDCRSPYKCYGGVCKVRSGGECSRSRDCFSNHYCSRSNNHCRSQDDYNLGDYSVEGVSVRSMLGYSNSIIVSTPKPTIKPTRVPTRAPTRSPTRVPTSAPTRVPTRSPTIAPLVITPTNDPTRSPTTRPPLLLETRISFKIAFAGIVPGAKCINTYLIPETRLVLDITNVPSNNHEDNIQTSFEETDDTDSWGNRIFRVTNLTLDKDKFGSVNNFNYIKIKGPWHLKRKMCQNEQKEKLLESTVCDINLNSDNVYDFSEYTLLSGDIDKNGIINAVDLSNIKQLLNPGAAINCGIYGDLNMDGVVNAFDLNLIKDTLTERDDE